MATNQWVPAAREALAASIEPFSVELTLTANVARLRLRGELDLATVPVLRECFEQAHLAGKPFVVFDASELSYCDSSGIAMLLQAAAQCAKQGTNMRLVGAQATVRRVIEITDTEESLNLVRQQ
jgi:anti-sigma B factor antagonist